MCWTEKETFKKWIEKEENWRRGDWNNSIICLDLDYSGEIMFRWGIWLSRESGQRGGDGVQGGKWKDKDGLKRQCGTCTADNWDKYQINRIKPQ